MFRIPTKEPVHRAQLGRNRSKSVEIGRDEEHVNSPVVRAWFEALGLDVWDAPRTRSARMRDLGGSQPSLDPLSVLDVLLVV